MIAIVNYEVGNLRSVQKAFEQVGCEALITSQPADITAADAIVLPGVGAFGAAVACLRASGLLPAVQAAVKAEKPFLGICVGMQMMFDYSEESFGGEPPQGLGYLQGAVRRFPGGLKIPQIGWNQLQKTQNSPLFAGVPDGAHVYFVHSYYCDPAKPEYVATTTNYGIDFCSSVHWKNLMAIQFHPEKSGRVGLRILRNFGEWAGQC